jgi:DNA polymerase III sliding clamp (beta) subunit (PCNA family)
MEKKKIEENEEIENDDEEIEEIEEKPKKKQVIKPSLDEDEIKNIELIMKGEKEIWTNMIDKLIGLQNDIALKITKKGISIRLPDDGNVALADHFIKNNAFDEYSVSEITIGVDLTKLRKHLKIFTGDLTVTNDKNKLVFKGEQGKTSRMGLLDSSFYNDIKIPEMKFDVSTKTPFENINKMVKIGDDFEVETLKFCVKDSKFIILIDGETDDVRFPICAINNLSGKKNFTTLYSKDYLNLFKFDNKNEVTIKFGKNSPLYLEYDDDKEHTAYLLAPRIENDDEEDEENEDK